MNLSDCSIYVTRIQRAFVWNNPSGWIPKYAINGLLILKPGITTGREGKIFSDESYGYKIDSSLITNEGLKILNSLTDDGDIFIKPISWVLRNRCYIQIVTSADTSGNTVVTSLAYIDPQEHPLRPDQYTPSTECPLTLHRANTVVNLGRL